jgi:hypothetical protein
MPASPSHLVGDHPARAEQTELPVGTQMGDHIGQGAQFSLPCG